jgi:hypothetical protein
MESSKPQDPIFPSADDDHRPYRTFKFPAPLFILILPPNPTPLRALCASAVRKKTQPSAGVLPLRRRDRRDSFRFPPSAFKITRHPPPATSHSLPTFRKREFPPRKRITIPAGRGGKDGRG